MRIEKAIEISEAKIQFVSLVGKAANKRQFLITKAESGDTAQFSTLGKILKVDEDTHYVTGIVYEPLVEDTQGNFMTEAEIRKAAYWFAKNGDKVDLQHSFEAVEGVTVVETYIAPCDMEIGGQAVLKGTWLMTAEVENAEVWVKVQKGEVTGFSMGGVGRYSEKDVELAAGDANEKKGLFKKMAGLFGFDVVEKGAVKDKYARSSKSSNFWNAFNALEGALTGYDWFNDRMEFETDGASIKEALSEFSGIITEVLKEPNIVKSLAEQNPVVKAGKKISGKNYTELQKIYNNIGALLETLSDKPEEDDSEVNKQKIQAMIDEAIAKAAAPVEPAAASPAELTAESVQAMIDEAVRKATAPAAPANEPLTAEGVQELIAKAMEPLLKSRGLPSNLGDDADINKSGEGHYLADIL